MSSSPRWRKSCASAHEGSQVRVRAERARRWEEGTSTGAVEG